MTEFSAWIGRSEQRYDRLDPARSNALLAAIGQPYGLQIGEPMPQLHHWLHFWDPRSPDQTGPDGHPRRGGFLPPISLPRRMWAGGRLIFRAPLILGDEVRRLSTIMSIEDKDGRSGALTFVTVRHELFAGDRLAVEEEQDLVYRASADAAPAAPPVSAVPDEDRAAPEHILPGPVMLFRYSALTLNSHRIHYDRPYAVGEEGYEDLVVQGPLQATLLADLATRRFGSPLRQFRFRGVSPAISGHALALHAYGLGDVLKLEATQRGARTMTAEAASE